MAECGINTDCQEIGRSMKCQDGMCICSEGYTYIENHWVLRGCYEKADLFASCVTTEQCIAMNRNTYCNPSNQCTCSAGYYFDGRECIIRYEGNLKAQEVYKAAVVAAACFIVAVVGIFVACIVRRTFCRRDHPTQMSDSAITNSDIFSISDEIAALRAVDKPPSYEEVLQIERTFYGVPPPEYSLIRSNSALRNQAVVGITGPEIQNSQLQETPADVHTVNGSPDDTECFCIRNTALPSPSIKNCCFSPLTESPNKPSSSVLMNVCEQQTRDFKDTFAPTTLNCGINDESETSTVAEGFPFNPSSSSLPYNEFPLSDGSVNISVPQGAGEANSQAFSYIPSTPQSHITHSFDTFNSQSLPTSPVISSHPLPHQRSLHSSYRRQLVSKGLLHKPSIPSTSLLPDNCKLNYNQCTMSSTRNHNNIIANRQNEGNFIEKNPIHEESGDSSITAAYDNPAYVADSPESS